MAKPHKRGDVPIDHARITDSFGEMSGRTSYSSFASKCGRCGAAFTFTAAAQKHVHERRGVPIKKARTTGYCPACTSARGHENRARERSTQLEQATLRAKAAADQHPHSGAKLLEYVVAKLRMLEQSWSSTAAKRLLGDVRRARRLDPKLRSAAKWETRLRELIERHDRGDGGTTS